MSFGVAEGIQIAKLAAELVPDLIQTFASLIGGGHSASEAQAIVRRDIKSRRTEYDRMKAEDHAALRAKHGLPPTVDAETPPEGTSVPSNPFDSDGDDE